MNKVVLKQGLAEAEAYLKRRNGGGGMGEAIVSPSSGPPGLFAERVRSLRKRLGLSQSSFADNYGLPLRTVQNWEQGRRTKPDSSGNLLIGLIERDPEGMRIKISAL